MSGRSRGLGQIRLVFNTAQAPKGDVKTIQVFQNFIFNVKKTSLHSLSPFPDNVGTQQGFGADIFRLLI